MKIISRDENGRWEYGIRDEYQPGTSTITRDGLDIRLVLHSSEFIRHCRNKEEAAAAMQIAKREMGNRTGFEDGSSFDRVVSVLANLEYELALQARRERMKKQTRKGIEK